MIAALRGRLEGIDDLEDDALWSALLDSVKTKTGAPISLQDIDVYLLELSQFSQSLQTEYRRQTGVAPSAEAFKQMPAAFLPSARAICVNAAQLELLGASEMRCFLERTLFQVAQHEAGLPMYALPHDDFADALKDLMTLGEDEYFRATDEHAIYEHARAGMVFSEGHLTYGTESLGPLHEARVEEIFPYSTAKAEVARTPKEVPRFTAEHQPSRESIERFTIVEAFYMPVLQGHRLMEEIMASDHPEDVALGFEHEWARNVMTLRKGRVAVPVPAGSSEDDRQELERTVARLLGHNPFRDYVKVSYVGADTAPRLRPVQRPIFPDPPEGA